MGPIVRVCWCVPCLFNVFTNGGSPHLLGSTLLPPCISGYGDLKFLQTVDTCYLNYMTSTLKMEAASAFETHQTNLPSVRVHITENLKKLLILELFTRDVVACRPRRKIKFAGNHLKVQWREMKWSEVQCREWGKNETLWEKFIWVAKWWEVKGWGDSVIKLCVGKNTRNCVQYFVTVVLFTFCTCCILRCLVCIVVSCLVCIVVVVCIVVILCVFAVLCVLLFLL